MKRKGKDNGKRKIKYSPSFTTLTLLFLNTGSVFIIILLHILWVVRYHGGCCSEFYGIDVK